MQIIRQDCPPRCNVPDHWKKFLAEFKSKFNEERSYFKSRYM
jgi:hypothetical protein